MTTPIHKVKYEGDSNELVEFVTEATKDQKWIEYTAGTWFNTSNDTCCTYYYEKFTLDNKYKEIIENSIGYKIISDISVWYYPKGTVHFQKHIDDTPYTGVDLGDAYTNKYACIIPIYGECNLNVWEEYSKTTTPYSIGDIVLLANQKYYHSADCTDIGKISLHCYIDKHHD